MQQPRQHQCTNIIYLEGNIGAGKSTVLAALKEHLLANEQFERYTILTEPVDEWRNVGGADLLKDYYQNPKRWSFLLNVHALNTLVERQISVRELPTKNHHCFLERSGRATQTIFVPYAHKTGVMSNAEFQIFNDSWKLLAGQLYMDMCYREVTIYLRTSPETCFQRLQQRNNSAEAESNNFTVDWLRTLHYMHEQWLLPLHPIIIVGDRPISDIVRDILTLFP